MTRTVRYEAVSRKDRHSWPASTINLDSFVPGCSTKPKLSPASATPTRPSEPSGGALGVDEIPTAAHRTRRPRHRTLPPAVAHPRKNRDGQLHLRACSLTGPANGERVTLWECNEINDVRRFFGQSPVDFTFALESPLFNSHGFRLDVPAQSQPQDRHAALSGQPDRCPDLAGHHRHPTMLNRGDFFVTNKRRRYALGLAINQRTMLTCEASMISRRRGAC
jgi:hypothetical protein